MKNFFAFIFLFALVSRGGSLPVEKLTPFFAPSAPVASGGGASCPPDGSPTVLQSGITDTFIANSDDPYIGMVYTNGVTATNLCKVQCKVSSVANTVGATITVRVYNLVGTPPVTIFAGAPIAETAGVAGNVTWGNTNIVFTFASDVPLSANTTYAIVITGNGGTGTGQYVKVEKGNTTISGRLAAWNASGTIFDPLDGTTPSFGLYMH